MQAPSPPAMHGHADHPSAASSRGRLLVGLAAWTAGAAAALAAYAAIVLQGL